VASTRIGLAVSAIFTAPATRRRPSKIASGQNCTVSESSCQELTRLAYGACSNDGRLSNTKLARMSSGRYCLIRDLGLVKGGRGLRHHEVMLELSWRSLVRFAMSSVRANRTELGVAGEPEAVEPIQPT